MQSSEKAYFTGALGVLVSRLTTIIAGVVSLWLLTRILDSADFAGYSVAMSVVGLLGYSIGLGTERSLLMQISERDSDGITLLGRRLARRIALLAAIMSALAILVLLTVLRDGQSPAHEFIRLMSPMVPALSVSLVLVTWYQANHRVGVSQSMQGLNDGVRCLFLGMTLAFGFGQLGVAVGALMGAAAPAVYLLWRAAGRTRPEPESFGLRDVLAGLQFLTMRVSQMGILDLGIIALGLLGTTTGTAQFAVALRFAYLIESAQTIFAPTFMPRVLRHLSQGRNDLAAREYRSARVMGFTAALALSIVLIFVGEPILAMFGDFGVNFSAFLILVAAFLLPVGMGMHATFLSMTDKLGYSTANRVFSIGVFALALWILVPLYDDSGAAVALLIALICHEVIGVTLYVRTIGGRPFDAIEGAVVVLSCVTLCATAVGFIAHVPAALILTGLLALSVARERILIGYIVRDVARIVTRQA